MAEDNDRSASAADAVVIKKYANRRLYNTETSTYVTLEALAQMVRADRDFVVRDAKTGDDLTHSVLTQIIVEQESRAGGPTLLPIPFLRQLIRYYDDSIAKMVPSYLQFSMTALAKEQERYRSQFTNWGPNAFEAYQEQARKNLAMFEQAFSMWSPMAGSGDLMPDTKQNGAAPGVPTGAPEQAEEGQPVSEQQDDSAAETTEIDKLKAELAEMQQRIERLSRS